MVAFTQFLTACAVATGALAAPVTDVAAAAPRSVDAVYDHADFVLGGENLARRQDYNQNYKTGGNVQFNPTNNGYSVSFSGAGDFVVGKGWRTGTRR
jgi:endo-1,4-beta-xylanase